MQTQSVEDVIAHTYQEQLDTCDTLVSDISERTSLNKHEVVYYHNHCSSYGFIINEVSFL